MPRVASAVWLDPTTKATLDRLVRSPSTRHGLVQRCRIVLAAAAGQTNQQIAGDLQMPEVTVSKWRRGFASQGLEGLQDAPRSGRPVKHGPEIIQRVQNRVCQQPEHYSRWSVRTLAKDLTRMSHKGGGSGRKVARSGGGASSTSGNHRTGLPRRACSPSSPRVYRFFVRARHTTPPTRRAAQIRLATPSLSVSSAEL